MIPTYKEIIKEIGARIKTLKKPLLLRTLMIVWLVLVAIIVGYAMSSFYGELYMKEVAFSFSNILFIIGYIILAVIYMLVVGFIFEIEKRIWIVSFFGKNGISQKESLGLAKKLLWPAIVFRFNIFFKYYFTPIVLLLATIFIMPILFVKTNMNLSADLIYVYLGMVIISIIAFSVYSYHILIKLRFSWFVFLDMYKGGKLEIHSIYEKMNLLNVTAKSEGFKKALILNVGVDSIKAIVIQMVVIMTVSTIETPGLDRTRRALGDITRVYGQSLIKQVTSYAEIVSIYILYTTAHQQTYGKEQEVNEYMYEKLD